MRFPVNEPFRITADFHESRPLSRPPAERDHVHGAWDIAVPKGRPILAPEDGHVQWYCHMRCGSARSRSVNWPDTGKWYAFSNYFYDMFGGLCVLYGESGKTHVFTHIYLFDLFAHFTRGREKEWYSEDISPVGTFYLFTDFETKLARQGDTICHSGNAGYSSGPHIHYELHRGRAWIAHGDREDPADLWPAIYKTKFRGNA